MCTIFPHLCRIAYHGKTRAPIRSLTIPHIVIIICSYFQEFNLNDLYFDYTNQMFYKYSTSSHFEVLLELR